MSGFPWHLFTTRKCRKGDACPDAGSPHTAHLTWIGKWRYTLEKPVFLRFARLYQIMVVAMAVLVAWSVVNAVVDSGTDRLFQGICGAIDAGLLLMWWHWGVQDVRSRDRHAAFVARMRKRVAGGDQS